MAWMKNDQVVLLVLTRLAILTLNLLSQHQSHASRDCLRAAYLTAEQKTTTTIALMHSSPHDSRMTGECPQRSMKLCRTATSKSSMTLFTKPNAIQVL